MSVGHADGWTALDALPDRYLAVTQHNEEGELVRLLGTYVPEQLQIAVAMAVAEAGAGATRCILWKADGDCLHAEPLRSQGVVVGRNSCESLSDAEPSGLELRL